MSDYYKPKRKYHLYQNNSDKPFKISRSKIDLFLECPRCFYLDLKKGTARPPGFPFSLNSAVDTLLKKEFDIHRAEQTRHPLMEAYGLKAVPFAHEKIEEWRNNLVGVRFLHAPTNFLIYGAIDDVWRAPNGDLIVVDYKSTSKTPPITLDAPWQDSYKRQMEVYQWLLRHNDFAVLDTGYFVYCNGRRDRKAFDARLEFDVELIPYKGNDNWIDKTLQKAKKVLESSNTPKADPACDYCLYREAAQE